MQKRTLYSLSLACVMLAYSCGSNEKEGKPQPLDTSTLTDGMKPAKPEAKKHPGEAVYANYCATCHQSNGTGVPGMYPPLTPNIYTENKDSLIKVVLNGMQGKIEVAGKVYNNYMAPHSHLSDQELADVISYVRSSFGNSFDAVTPAEIAAARKEKPSLQ
ncbi:MAG: cytochrome c [Prolixibacteraceae bacterium]